MPRFVVLFAVLLLAGMVPSRARADMTAQPTSRYGTVHLSQPQGELRGVVILFSGEKGWGAAEQQAAGLIAAEGALVVGVDSAYYLSHIDTVPEKCELMEGDAETIARQLQREHGGGQYFLPIYAGIGAGGALAGQVLGLAPVNSIAGAVAVDPVESAAVAALPCGRGATALNGFWEIGATPSWKAADVYQAGPAFRRHDLPAGGEAAAQLAALVVPHLAPRLAAEEVGSVADLPLVELPAEHPTGRLAVVLSGDGGWRDIDRSIAQTLKADGVSTVGFDCLRYFWSERSPEQTAADLARVLRAYRTRWHTSHIALIGYSFGADVLPFVYPLLPEDVRAHVELLSLVGLSTGADFEIRVVGWFGAAPSGRARPMAPQLKKLPPAVVQCIYSSEEKSGSSCPELAGTAADLLDLPGGHHFNGDYEGLTRHILSAWNARAKP